MTQQINLILPELRPKFDWLALQIVASVALLGFLLVFVLAQVLSVRLDRIKSQADVVSIEMTSLQQQLQSLGQALSQRHGDANLPQKIESVKVEVADRKEVLAFVNIGQSERAPEFSRVFEGLSAQKIDGVWLTGFQLVPSAIELQGRLLDPVLLPAYISRLNAETVFFGRRFSALEMKGVDPVKIPDGQEKPSFDQRYTEFALRTDAIVAEKKQ